MDITGKIVNNFVNETMDGQFMVTDPTEFDQVAPGGPWTTREGAEQVFMNYVNEKMGEELQVVMRLKESEEELKRFCQEVRQHIGDEPIIVELGSYMGESALIFAREFPNGTIHCIDTWVGGFDDNDTCSGVDYMYVENQFNHRMGLVNNIVKHKCLSTEMSIECDMVYIDACHTYECVKTDIQHWLPVTKKIVSGHDYHLDSEFLEKYPHVGGVAVAVDEVLGKPDQTFEEGSWFKILNK